VIVFHDTSNGFGHWALWTIPGETRTLPAAIADSATLTDPFAAQQVNLGQGDGYFGPGSCMNVYEFKIYAISAASFTPANATSVDTVQDELEASISNPDPDEPQLVLGTAYFRGRANPDDC